tara:strand:- start:295 stop:1329 length:1035 start_codon:yes stop_codon:yes gene_type:complete
MIDLRSDTVTLPSKEMKEFMFDAPLGDDVFGEDPSINALQDKASNLFQKEKALFVPSGTMANLISVLTHCNRGDEILLGNKSHIFKYEAGGASAFGGIHSHQLNNNDDGTIDINNIIENIRDTRDDHFPKTKLLCLENTHNFCYGSAITQEYIAEVKSQISQFNIKLHIDGARIFNAATSLNCSVSTLAQDADSITFCLSKGLSCPSGSLILGTSDFIKKAKKIRKGLGGGMRQAGILASAGIYALDNLTNRLGEDHENALLIAKGLEDVDNIDIDISKVSTNLIFFYLKKNDLSDESFINKLLENKIKIDSKGNRKFRIATHYGFASDNIERVINTIKSIVNN